MKCVLCTRIYVIRNKIILEIRLVASNYNYNMEIEDAMRSRPPNETVKELIVRKYVMILYFSSFIYVYI